MPSKKDKTRQILKDAETTFDEFMGYLSKRASQGEKVTPEELELVLRVTKQAKLVRKQIEENENLKSKSDLEKLAGKKVKNNGIISYECDEFGDLGYAELITFVDGTHKIHCELGYSRDCKHSCGFELL